MSKNVLMIGWEYPPNITGGLGIACQGLAFALAKKDVKIQFIVPRTLGNEKTVPGLELSGVTDKRHLLSENELALVTFMEKEIIKSEAPSSAYGRYGEPPGGLASDKEWSDTNVRETKLAVAELKGGYTSEIFTEINRYAIWLGIIAKKLDFDVIHCHDWMSFPAGLAAAAASGKPLICHVHSTEFDRSGEHVNQRIYDMERDALHKCQKVIAVSDFTKSILVNRYGINPDKISTVHNGVEFNNDELMELRYNRLVAPREKLVLFMGRITFQKGPEYFVQAAKKVIDKMKNVRFVMAGTGDMYHNMIELAADMGIGKYFHYTGFLRKEEVTRLLKMVDLYVMPSVSEPFGIASLEAMMHDVPVIMSKQSGVSEVITNCIKVDFWDVDEMAEKMTHVLQNNSLHSELQSKGKIEAITVNWDNAAEKTKAIYEQYS